MRVEAMMGNGSGGWQSGRAFALGAPPAGTEYSRSVPVADVGTVEAGARLPLLQAMITAAAAALLAVLAAWWWELAWALAPIVGVITFCLTWWLLLIQSRQLLSSRELVSNDGNRQGEQAFSVSVEITDRDRGQMRFAQFDAKPVQVARFASAMINGQTTIYGNHGLSRRVFSRLRDEAVARGLCAWVDPDAHTQGITLTRAGEHVFERLLLEKGS